MRREEIPNTLEGGIPDGAGKGIQNTDGADPEQGGQMMNIEQGRRKGFKRRRESIILYLYEGGGGIPNVARRNSGGGRGMSNVDKGQTRREDEYSQTRMVEKSTRGGGGRGVPNEEGDDMPNVDLQYQKHQGRVVMQCDAISKGVGLQTDAGARGERFSFTTDGE